MHLLVIPNIGQNARYEKKFKDEANLQDLPKGCVLTQSPAACEAAS
jgi:hypothetical protein